VARTTSQYASVVFQTTLGIGTKEDINLIDSHCHMDDPCFDMDREQCIANAEQQGVSAQIIPSIKAEWWPRVKAVCEQWPTLHPAYGLHPMFEPDHRKQDIELLKLWLANEHPIAIGECGLDFYIKNPNKKRQLEIFEAQVALAAETQLPLIIHARKSVEEVLLILKQYPGLKGVCHSFSGSLQQAEHLIERGFFLGFGGPATYPRAKRLHRLLAELPLEAILLETDAPDQPPVSHQGKRNEPALLGEIAESLCQLKEVPVEVIRSTTRQSAQRLFNLTD